jgi:hypothetical protein
LSEHNGLQAPHPPALVTVEAPLAADIVGCPGGLVNDGPPDGRLMGFFCHCQAGHPSLKIISACCPFRHLPLAVGCVSYRDIAAGM